MREGGVNRRTQAHRHKGKAGETAGTQDKQGTRAYANVYTDGARNRLQPPTGSFSTHRFDRSLIASPCLQNLVSHFTGDWGWLGGGALPFVIVPGSVLLNDVPLLTTALGLLLT